ncbi:MAG: hypothetical protein AABZ30_13615 [Myxococcota bacterium]
MRSSETGSTLVIAILGLVAVLSVAGLAVISVRIESQVLAHDAHARIAHYAAEAGLEAGVDSLARRCVRNDLFTGLIRTALPKEWGHKAGADTAAGESSSEPFFAEDGNVTALPAAQEATAEGNLLCVWNAAADSYACTGNEGTADTEIDNDAWYEVTYENNADDVGGLVSDTDGTMIIRSVGHAADLSESMILAAYHADTCLAANAGEYAMEGGSDRGAIDVTVSE